MVRFCFDLWASRLCALRAFSDREIGRRLGTDGQTVVRIANGQQPRYDVGESLKAVFWERYEVYSRAMDEFTDWVAKQER